jgi:uncharacterized membrane protein YphA (DoxX/SURF4 family)
MSGVIDALIDSAPGFASIMAVTMAAVFAVAAISKLRSPTSTEQEFAGLGVPRPRLLARVVPVFEIVTAATLLVAPPAGGLLSMMLLVAFTAVITATIRSGRTVTCGCLGAMSRKPITIATAIRNLVFIAASATAAATPSLVVPSLPTVAVVTLLVALVAIGTQLAALQRTLGRVWSVELAGEPAVGNPAASRKQSAITQSVEGIGGMTA